MASLHHFSLCAASRFIRLAAAEIGLDLQLVDERPWERSHAFLALNPAGTTPVLVEESTPSVPVGWIIAEYLDETRGLALGDRRLLPDGPADRIEVRRLIDWFLMKFDSEVTRHLVDEKVVKRFLPPDQGGGGPDMAAIRAARANIRYHLKYIGWLLRDAEWLAGPKLSYADLAAAAQLSCVDYLGDVPWDEDQTARTWYAKVKSRPSFRTLLTDVVKGAAPSAHYANLDF